MVLELHPTNNKRIEITIINLFKLTSSICLLPKKEKNESCPLNFSC
jgi:hypothetical protein